MLETEIKKLTVAVEANTKAVLEAVGTPAIGTVAAQPAVPNTTAAGSAIAAAPAAPAAAPAAVPAAPAAAAAPAATPAAAADPAALPPATKDQIVDATVACAENKGREVAMGILAKYGATRVPELEDESVWPNVLAELVAANAS